MNSAEKLKETIVLQSLMERSVPEGFINTIPELEWKPFPGMDNYFYAEGDVDGHLATYYVKPFSKEHPIREYRGRISADINGCSLYVYRPAKTPTFFNSISEAKAACQYDYINLRMIWWVNVNGHPNNYRTFASIS